jgi:hypothetical protein
MGKLGEIHEIKGGESHEFTPRLEVGDEVRPSTKSAEGIEEKLLQTRGWKIGWKYSKNQEKENWTIQLGDEIHAQRSDILIESNVYKVWKPPQYPPTVWRIGGISHFLSSPLLHHEAHQHLSKSHYG